MHPSSNEIYDQFAPYYKHYSKNKSRYISAVDSLVLDHVPHARHVLDVGCGDGSRGVRLARAMSCKELMLVDSSKMMIDLANSFKGENIDVVRSDISLAEPGHRLPQRHFDVVLCLWNVLGHIADSSGRIQALLNIRESMTDQGKLLVDISNRYNVAYYGPKKVATNVLRNLLYYRTDNGDFAYTIDAGDIKINSYCHFFTPKEFPKLCKKAGLKIEKKMYVDYTDGSLTNILAGHIFYVVRKDPKSKI